MSGLRIYFFLIVIAQAFSLFNLMPYEVGFASWTSTGTSIWDWRIRLLGRELRPNGTVIIKEDIDEDHHTLSIDTYNDAFGSGNFKLTPFVVRQQSFCKAIANFWFYLEASVPYGEKTDLPFQNHTCPIPKGQYYLKDLIIKPEKWPVAMPRGYFKYALTFKKDQNVVGTMDIVIHVVDRTV